ncbi:MAG TPA: ABC transporter substrate-binding protein [Xanthobacteraceae bacterium]|nr:ABC transporter substrate-binding protein [Xanthobacteraceae bacterium]
MDKIAFPYRSSSHLIMLHVIAESGSWEKHGLDVDYDRKIGSEDAQAAIEACDIEFCGGNHVSTYGLRARGSNWVYLGQTVNRVNHHLVVRPDSGINSVADLRGKKLGGAGSHPILNNWLFLKQRGLDQDRDDYELVCQEEFKPGTMDEVKSDKKVPPLWHWVRDGVVDAAFVSVPASLFAKAAGLKLIDVEPLPMIQFSSVSTNLKFVEKHPDIVERFLKGMLEGIAFFKNNPEKSIEIIQRRYTKSGQMNREQAEFTYRITAPTLEAKLYPTMQAIANVYEEALRVDKDAARVNPMELWDLHHLRRLDDSGFIDNLYKNSGTTRHSPTPAAGARAAEALATSRAG